MDRRFGFVVDMNSLEGIIEESLGHYMSEGVSGVGKDGLFVDTL